MNADEIARGLSPLNPAGQAMFAGRLVLKRIREIMQKRESFAIETTLAGHALLKNIKRAREAGYKIEMYYIFSADINVNIGRVKNRVKQGKHDVPVSDIRRRYWRSLKNWLSPYKNFCDIMHIYDTTAGEPEEIAFWENGEPMVRYNEALCERFAAKVIEARDEH